MSFRPRTKSYLLALGVSSRRAAARSLTEHAGRRAVGIGINSTKVRDNTQAIGSSSTARVRDLSATGAAECASGRDMFHPIQLDDF